MSSSEIPVWLQTAGVASQVIIAMFTAGAAIYAVLEYQKSKRVKKLDLAIQAIETWEHSLNEYTGAAIGLLRNDGANHKFAKALKANQTIKLQKGAHLQKSYGFVLSKNGEIPSTMTNHLRFTLIQYLNAWEVIAVLYEKGLADREVIDTHLITDRSLSDMYRVLKPFMDLYDGDSEAHSDLKDPQSWASVRRLFDGTMQKL